jgi:hypothetical protein
MSHGSIILIPMIQLELHRRSLFNSKITDKSDQKCLVSIILSTSGINSLRALLTGMRYDAEFFRASVLPDVERNLCDGKRRKMSRDVYLPFRQCISSQHQTAAARNCPNQIHQSRGRPYSPDAAPSDFFLFGCLKGKMASFTANSRADILSEIRQIFQEISKDPSCLCTMNESHESSG